MSPSASYRYQRSQPPFCRDGATKACPRQDCGSGRNSMKTSLKALACAPSAQRSSNRLLADRPKLTKEERLMASRSERASVGCLNAGCAASHLAACGRVLTQGSREVAKGTSERTDPSNSFKAAARDGLPVPKREPGPHTHCQQGERTSFRRSGQSWPCGGRTDTSVLPQTSGPKPQPTQLAPKLRASAPCLG